MNIRNYIIAVTSSITWLSGALFAQDGVDFNRDVRAILSDKCFVCHGPDAKNRKAELRLDVRDDALSAGVLMPGNADQSEVIRRVSSHDPDEKMPPASSKLESLTAVEVNILKKWIGEGAKYQPHWSFIPLRREELPLALSPDGQHPIDRILAPRLVKLGLTAQPEADRATLIRRLTFDLTGLPPSSSEVGAFVKGNSPSDYEKLVDRLLARESYGERMAVDWLDAARYADSYGFQVDREREMWPWRDWVIRAFNQNLPFDQFITWQIAGDLLPNASDDQILATAFNRLHQQEAEGGSVEEEYRVEYVCDRVQTFATSMLGLTFDCARCHDHKYDPITQRDYYGLFAMFHNIDEAGLYSYFTQSPPTPTLWLADGATKASLMELQSQVRSLESRSVELAQTRRSAFDMWLAERRGSDTQQVRTELRTALQQRRLADFSFDALDGGKLANEMNGDQPAKLHGENQLVEGHTGKAVQFSGDDAVDLPLGNFKRHEPFSISLWIKTPDVKERAVIFHRSRAWTDAASRGYELLIEDGKLKWSLIHFWPGNAISIATDEKLPTNRWVHVTVTYDGSSRAAGLHIYVHDADSTSILNAVGVIKDDLSKEITGGGGDNIALGERFRDRGFKGGQIDSMQVFGRELSSLEAGALVDEESAIDRLMSAADSKPTEQQLAYEYYLNSHDSQWAEHLANLKAARSAYEAAADPVKEIMVMRELKDPKKAYILARGEYIQRRAEVSAGVPSWLLPLPEGAPTNRLGLARWLTDPRHPLTARVAVNRIWQSMFGSGLVKTSEDFGSQGARPVYPELLDWLAQYYIDIGWDTKALVKTIVMSQTYRQRSWADGALMTDDPDNDWLARGPRFRLPAEMIRDNALMASGLLKLQVGGPPVNPYEMSEAFKPAKASTGDGVYRRSLYTNWRRTGPPPAMVAFDAPRRAVCIARRERTDSPLQALVLMNGVQYVEASRVLGETLHASTNGDIERMIELGAMRCLSRPADQAEIKILKRLYEEQLAHFTEHSDQAAELLKVGSAARNEMIPVPQAAAATVLAQALLNHDICVVKR